MCVIYQMTFESNRLKHAMWNVGIRELSNLRRGIRAGGKCGQKQCLLWGVKQPVQDQILQELQFVKGELPFRYLGVPLSNKRMSIVQCKPLIDKMLSRVTSWTTKFLSYAGRAQLVKNVLFSIQTFRAQISALPKKILHAIESICRKFLWTKNVEASKKHLLPGRSYAGPRLVGD